jgi:hypothetical protein
VAFQGQHQIPGLNLANDKNEFKDKQASFFFYVQILAALLKKKIISVSVYVDVNFPRFMATVLACTVDENLEL